MAAEIIMPRLTDTMLEGRITYWYKTEGESVQENEPFFVVETDKAAVEVMASVTGVLLKILVEEGGSAAVGATVAIVGGRGEEIESLLAGITPEAEEAAGFFSERREEVPPRVKASPAAKREARAENVDLAKVNGTGEDGLITVKDVKEYLEKKQQTFDTSRGYGPSERIPLEGVRKVMAEKMSLSSTIPQVTTVAETDVTGLVELSRETSITITSFVVRSVVEGLRVYPLINARLDGNEIIVMKYYNIGVSVASPQGLVVPVLHNTEGKDIHTISRELADLAKKTRENRLTLEDVSGRTFTVTNSGVFGSLFFTPRINPPDSAILGMGKIMRQPVVINEAIAIRSMIYLSLSYDHRIIDGETAVKFLQEVKRALESPSALLEDPSPSP